MFTKWAVTFFVSLIVPCVFVAQAALATSALDQATTQCLFEVDGAEDIHVTIKSKAGGETMRVKNKATRKTKNDPLVDAYTACVQRKISGGVYAAPTVAASASAKNPNVQAASAIDNSTVGLTRQCMRKVRAPGKYAVSVNRAIPDVIPDLGGTQAGAHNVQDCLHDRLDVQYRILGTSTAQANGVVSSGASSFACPKRASVIYGGSQYCRL